MTEKCLAALTDNTVILNTFAAWQESHTLLDINISFLRRTLLWDNPNLSHHIADSILQSWRNRKIEVIADLYINDTLDSFQQLNKKFNLPKIVYFSFSTYRSETGLKRNLVRYSQLTMDR